jgi:sec-independent protein translocase protein TatA
MIGSITDWAILIVVALLLFGGSKKIPELARGLGRAMGEFRRGQAEVEKELRAMTDTAVEQKPQNGANANNSASVQQSVAPAGRESNSPATVQSADRSSIEARIEQLEHELRELRKTQTGSK